MPAHTRTTCTHVHAHLHTHVYTYICMLYVCTYPSIVAAHICTHACLKSYSRHQLPLKLPFLPSSCFSFASLLLVMLALKGSSVEKLNAVSALHGATNDAQKANQKEQVDVQRCPLNESSSAAPANKVSHVAVHSSQAHLIVHEHRVPKCMLTSCVQTRFAICKLQLPQMSCSKAVRHSLGK